jgi:tetratricopeptide (TPR) repeat protein
MGQEQARQLLQQGIAAARGGQADMARQLFRQAARLEPRNEAAWQWLITVAEDNNERSFCLKQLLTINPQNERAREALQRLSVEQPGQPAAAPAAQQRPERRQTPPGITVPILDDDKHVRLQQVADDFLHLYNPEPVDRLNISWTQKQKGRYGEGGATRLQRTMYGAAALLIVVLVGAFVVLIRNVGLPVGGGKESALLPTRVPSLTATLTLTPTIGGPTPTPFPATMDVPATSVALGLERGDPYGLKTPTEIHPRVDVDVRYGVEQAVEYYSIGDYATALEQLQAEREKSRPACYPSIVYYQALSLAGMGNFRLAESTIEQAQSEVVQQGYESCQDSPLLIAGLGEIAYMQDPQSQSALDYSEQALAARVDPPLVQASLTKAQVELARGDFTSARSTVALALEDWPQDANLLILAAQVELANNQPQAALGYVGRVLYAEPALQPALYLQTDIYLRLAELAQTAEQRLQYYGLAVRSAQTVQLYYSGDPVGYLYLAKARLGEGNEDLAETELNRILAVEDSLPDSASAVIQEAHRVRGDLYYEQGRLEAARVDYDKIDQVDPTAAVRLIDINFRLGDYQANLALIDRLAAERDNEAYLLLQAKLYVEICTFHPEQLTCEYRDMLEDVLTDGFIARLETEDQRADAYAYRAQARYWDTRQRGVSLSTSERQLAYQLAENDLNQALMIRESPVDHYYRGLILEELDETFQAYDEYQWIVYWGDVYRYPFADSDFENRVARMGKIVQDAVEMAAATPTPVPGVGPEETAAPTPSPTRQVTSTPRPTPTRTPTPTLPPTAVPPAQIP